MSNQPDESSFEHCATEPLTQLEKQTRTETAEVLSKVLQESIDRDRALALVRAINIIEKSGKVVVFTNHTVTLPHEPWKGPYTGADLIGAICNAAAAIQGTA